MRNINLEAQHQSQTHYGELVEEIKEQIKKYAENDTETWGAKKIQADLPFSRRKELDITRQITRVQMESLICLGVMAKATQGGIGNESVYTFGTNECCPYFIIKDGYAQCQCQKEKFQEYKLNKGKYIPVEEVLE